MKAFIEVLCPGNVDSGSALHLFIDGTRFQFGCGDGAQRTAVETGVKPSKLAAIFIPSLCARDIGGLPGMLLTASDAGLTRIVVAGPIGLRALLSAARPFFMRPTLTVHIEEVGDDERIVFKDALISVRSFPISEGAVVYVARVLDLPGRFDPKKAAVLGVPRGRLYGVLQKGESITLNGKDVHPSQVMDASIPGPVVVALPCISAKAIAKLTKEARLSAPTLETNSERISLAVHFSGHETVADSRYQSWTTSLGPNTRHLALHTDFAPERAIFYANASELAMLHYTIDEQIFPLPERATRPYQPVANLALDPAVERASHPAAMDSLPKTWLRADLRLRLNLAPSGMAGKLDVSNVPDARVPRNPAAPRRPWGRDLEKLSKKPSVSCGISTDDATTATSPNIAHLENSKAEVMFLGTGGAIPGKHRNVSAVHVNIPPRCGVLLDCGEGTYGQLWRALGEEGSRAALEKLRVLFISHMHADHHLGALRILSERARLSIEPKVAVVAPMPFKAWLDAALLGDSAANVVNFFDAGELTDPQAPAAQFFTDSMGLELGTVRVLHCPDAYGIVLHDTIEHWKLVYSGDTRPCDALIDAGSGASLLIHEATLDDRLPAEARAKMHSTVGEALTVASRMGAWRTILTHFSQRYPKVPALDDGTILRMRDVSATVACDFMRIPFARLEELPGLTPVIRDAFEKDVEDLLHSAPPPVEALLPSEIVT